MKDKPLLYLSLTVVCYFAILFMNTYWLKISHPVFSFLQELLTIPMLVLQAILLVIAIYKTVIKRVNSRQVKTALFFLIVTSIVTYGSLVGIIKMP